MQRWQLFNLVGASLLAAATGACVGGIDSTSPGADGDGDGDDGGDVEGSADEMFAALQPKLVAECGACHVGGDLADTATGQDFLGPAGAPASDSVASGCTRAARSFRATPRRCSTCTRSTVSSGTAGCPWTARGGSTRRPATA